MAHDHVDRALAQWARERPDLDVSPMAVVGRISRFAKIAGKRMEKLFAAHDLTPEGFDVLATLFRSDAPQTPTQLFQRMMVSSGTMTNRLDRLEKLAYVQRHPDPADRRGTLIHLTRRGREALDNAVVDHLANERRLLASLTSEEQETLASLLRKLLLPLEDERPD